MRLFVAHHDRVVDASVLREVLVEVIFVRVESEASNKKFDLVLFSRLVERRGGSSVIGGALAHAHSTKAVDPANIRKARQTKQRVY